MIPHLFIGIVLQKCFWYFFIQLSLESSLSNAIAKTRCSFVIIVQSKQGKREIGLRLPKPGKSRNFGRLIIPFRWTSHAPYLTFPLLSVAVLRVWGLMLQTHRILRPPKAIKCLEVRGFLMFYVRINSTRLFWGDWLMLKCQFPGMESHLWTWNATNG